MTSHFEEALWETVAQRHGAALAEAPAAAPRSTRPRRAVGVGLVAALAACAGAVTLGVAATSTPPAYAVSRQSDGSVLVKLTRPSAVIGANAKLKAMGVPAYLVALAPGHHARCVPAPATLVSPVAPIHPGRTPTRPLLSPAPTTVLIPAPKLTRARPEPRVRPIAPRLVRPRATVTPRTPRVTAVPAPAPLVTKIPRVAGPVAVCSTPAPRR